MTSVVSVGAVEALPTRQGSSTEPARQDAESRAWVRALHVSGREHDEAVGRLHELLLRAARFEVGRRRATLPHLRGNDFDDLAMQSADDALVAVLSKLDTYRGDSKFTTWAYKFAVNIALTAARRERWKTVSLDHMLDENEAPVRLPGGDPAVQSPEQRSQQGEVWALVQQVMDAELTPRQRRVLRAMVFDEVPLDEVVRHLGSNRNAVYKLVHDARRKLKAGLEARGYSVADILDLFGGAG